MSAIGRIEVYFRTIIAHKMGRINPLAYENKSLFSAHSFDAATVSQFTPGSPEDATYGLGGRVNGNASMTPTFGVLASSQTYGHTGWTGTLTAIDPVNHMAIVILGNSLHLPVAAPKANPKVFVSG
jgi:CubicO group peptidase (beta-lactamase class C family)